MARFRSRGGAQQVLHAGIVSFAAQSVVSLTACGQLCGGAERLAKTDTKLYMKEV